MPAPGSKASISGAISSTSPSTIASIDASAAEGAAISYTGDRENDTDTAEIHAVAAWVFARNPCSPIGEPPIGRPYVSGYAFAASVLGDGTLTADRTDEKSALKPGLDAQIEIANGPALRSASSNRNALLPDRLSRRSAQAYGFSATWQPYQLDWRLGGSYHQFSSAFDFFYQLKAEADGLAREQSRSHRSHCRYRLFLARRHGATERASLLPDLLQLIA